MGYELSITIKTETSIGTVDAWFDAFVCSFDWTVDIFQ